MFGRSEKKVFGWVVAQPRARVTGTLIVKGEKRTVLGPGYHDHNWGNGFLPSFVSRWIWGRQTTDRVTMIFAEITTTKKSGRFAIPVLFLAVDD